ncbi:MAG: hypothetical protein GQ569_00595 [Methylococcaceae bacterium]|nr:hypothetical protein [Methylococcaceae bacterium]
MGRFDDEKKSRFDELELEALFSEEEKVQLNEIKAVLKQAGDDNEKIAKLQDMGEKGLKVLFKIAKKLLI